MGGLKELLLDGGEGRGRGGGELGAGEGGAGDFGGDGEGAGDLRQRHFFEGGVVVTLEEAASGGEELEGGVPFLFAELAKAQGPVGREVLLEAGGGGGVLLEEAGVEGIEAVAPVVFAGPVFDGGEGFVKFVGDGLVRSGLAEVEPGEEGIKCARGFARGGGKGRGGSRRISVVSIHIY